MNKKLIIYQLFPRLFTNRNTSCVPGGTISENGAGKMNDITPRVLKSLKELGVSHVWYTGVIEHSTKTDYTRYGIAKDNDYIVKGNAGSPYAIKDYYDIDPDIAVDVDNRMGEFEKLVERTHKAGLKVIIDFVPNHVARQYHSDAKPQGIEDLGQGDDSTYFFKPSNNFYYITRQLFSPSIDLGDGDNAYYEFPAKATGNDCFNAFPTANDWYETVKLNYGVDYGDGSRHFTPIPNTWFKMLHILRFWASKGVDGFRCDMAFMVPIEFWSWAIRQVKEKYPEILFIAELYDVGIYRDFINVAGFDYLYDKVNLYDTLRAIQCSNVSAACLTNCWQTVEGISDKMLNFMENHDEQRFASRFFAGSAALALPVLVASTTMSRAPFLLYQGQELGEAAIDSEGFSGDDGRTTIFDYWSIPSVRRWYNNGKCDGGQSSDRELSLRNLYIKVLNIATSEKAIVKGDFFDLMYVNYNNPHFDPHRMYSYVRSFEDETIFVILNFGNHDVDAEVNVPYHLFETLGVEQGEYSANDLITGEVRTIVLDVETRVKSHINGHSAVMCKLKKVKKQSAKKKTPQKGVSNE